MVLVSISQDGLNVFTGSGDGTVRLWDAETGDIIEEGRFYVGELITDLAFTPDGTVALTAESDGELLLWDATTGREIFPLHGHTDAV
jgi:WD40 repeat protein